MSEIKTQIFISSRFGEFSELRKHLCDRINAFPVFPLEAIDFDDGRMSHKPPIENCIASIRQSELMILILGETYGGIPKGYQLSYTHLEYKAAVDDKSNTVVLPFFIGPSYQNRKPPFTDHEMLRQFHEEVLDNHTPGFFDSDEDPKQLALRIFEWAWKTLYDARAKTVQQQMELEYNTELIDGTVIGDEGDFSVGLQSDEIAFLEDRIDHGDGAATAVFDAFARKRFGAEDVNLVPACVAAFEQYSEALKAIEIGERALAISHLLRSVELKPLEYQSVYELSKQLLLNGRKKDCTTAQLLALRAAKMAHHDKRMIRTVDCYILASKAARKSGSIQKSLEYASAAVNLTPWLASARIELACANILNGNLKEAYNDADFAFNLQSASILKLSVDQVFIEHKEHLTAIYRHIGTRIKKSLDTLCNCIDEIVEIGGEIIDENIIKSMKTIKNITVYNQTELLRLFAFARYISKSCLVMLQNYSLEKFSEKNIQRKSSLLQKYMLGFEYNLFYV